MTDRRTSRLYNVRVIIVLGVTALVLAGLWQSNSMILDGIVAYHERLYHVGLNVHRIWIDNSPECNAAEKLHEIVESNIRMIEDRQVKTFRKTMGPGTFMTHRAEAAEMGVLAEQLQRLRSRRIAVTPPVVWELHLWPVWSLVLTAVGVKLLHRVVEAFTVRRRLRDNRCLFCGYDLRGSGDLCPECGHIVVAPIDVQAVALHKCLVVRTRIWRVVAKSFCLPAMTSFRLLIYVSGVLIAGMGLISLVQNAYALFGQGGFFRVSIGDVFENVGWCAVGMIVIAISRWRL